MQKPTLTTAQIAGKLASAGLDLSPDQVSALARFLELLQRWNRVYNLTGIRDIEELVARHLVESLALRSLQQVEVEDRHRAHGLLQRRFDLVLLQRVALEFHPGLGHEE